MLIKKALMPQRARTVNSDCCSCMCYSCPYRPFNTGRRGAGCQVTADCTSHSRMDQQNPSRRHMASHDGADWKTMPGVELLPLIRLCSIFIPRQASNGLGPGLDHRVVHSSMLCQRSSAISAGARNAHQTPLEDLQGTCDSTERSDSIQIS